MGNNKLVKILIISLAVLGLAGCGEKPLGNSSKDIIYNLDMGVIVDIDSYEELIKDILTYREFDEQAKILIQDKYSEFVSQTVFNQLETVASNYKTIYAGIPTGEGILNENGEYPIYDLSYNVVDYGTYDEYIESLENFNAHDLNDIESVQASRSKIIFKIRNKYNGVYYVYGLLEGNKIISISILK